VTYWYRNLSTHRKLFLHSACDQEVDELRHPLFPRSYLRLDHVSISGFLELILDSYKTWRQLVLHLPLFPAFCRLPLTVESFTFDGDFQLVQQVWEAQTISSNGEVVECGASNSRQILFFAMEN
jgi:hypothetical protein